MRVQPDDLTAKARIREAALELFARDGVQGTSMRSVAARAKVSPSLVVHHFGTKAKLRDAVDDSVVMTFTTALDAVDLAGTPTDVSDQINRAISAIIGGDPTTREYLRRSLLEASPASQQLFDSLADLIVRGMESLERAGHVRRDLDTRWAAHAVLFIVLGPIVLQRQLEVRLGEDPFAAHVVDSRSATNIRILQAGLFRT